MSTTKDKRATFAALHAQPDAFILPNPWDLGSAQMLAARGALALATTSSGFAFTLGLPDGSMTAELSLAHAAAINQAVRVPVSADLENGYADSAEGVAETVRRAVDVGLAGCCIEDLSLAGQGNQYAYDLQHSVERIAAAVEATQEARWQGFQLCARADGVMTGHYNTEEAIRRAVAFEKVGADVLYAPMLPDTGALRELCASVRKPVNALAAGSFLTLSQEEFAELGVRRISLGSSLARATHALIDKAALAMLSGNFTPMIGGMDGENVNTLLSQGIVNQRESGS
jgi:2-methylisocitrate lyase-like PEP mutase family enzyme